MKNVVAVISLTAATATIGWTFGSGHLTAEGFLTLVLSWMGIVWGALED